DADYYPVGTSGNDICPLSLALPCREPWRPVDRTPAAGGRGCGLRCRIGRQLYASHGGSMGCWFRDRLWPGPCSGGGDPVPEKNARPRPLNQGRETPAIQLLDNRAL